MAGNGRRCRSRWDNAANVAQALRAATQAWTGGAAANSAAPPLSEAFRAAARSLGKLVPLRELLVSFCGWFVSTSLSPCAPDRKAQAALAILPEFDEPLGRRERWPSPSRSS